MGKNRRTWELGDFQTPDDLAVEVLATLQRLGIQATSILEPTCGGGSLLLHAARAYPQARRIVGVEIQPEHLNRLRDRLLGEARAKRVELVEADFFQVDWGQLLASLPDPILILGNPPWVTNSDLSALRSTNLPQKSNFHARNGLEALTGKSNFDISEWMILQHLAWLQGRQGVVAMLCKTMVARKVLYYSWQQSVPIANACLFKINAVKHFKASVDACLLVLGVNEREILSECSVFESLSDLTPSHSIGHRDGLVLADVEAYCELRKLAGNDTNYVWRSGIKHDCARVMELEQIDRDRFVNGYGDEVRLETAFLYPLLKSSDVANGKSKARRKFLLVTQKAIGEDTHAVQYAAPNTWAYLQRYRDQLAGRASSIYRNRPEFSIFGVGEYSFTPWKVAISGFYKRLSFVPISPVEGKPVVFDDTVYFLPCHSQAEAEFVAGLLGSALASRFFNSMIFWEDKRPITIDLLRRLDLRALARELGCEDSYLSFAERALPMPDQQAVSQLSLF